MWLSWLINWLSWLINWLRTGSLSQSESEGENEVETSSLCSVVENEVETRGSSAPARRRIRLGTLSRREYDFDDFRDFSWLSYRIAAFEENDIELHSGGVVDFEDLLRSLSELDSPLLSPNDVPGLVTRSRSMPSNGIAAFEENEVNDTGNNVMIPFPVVAQDHQYENNANAMRSRTTLNDDVGQSNSVIPPAIIQGVPQVNYSYATNTDGGDEQNNGEICLSLEVIKQHFHMNMDDAAKGLKVSRSTLKRKCRIHGIKRWPYRNRRNINDTGRSNENNLNKLTNTVGCASSSNSSVTIKAKCGDDIIKFSLPVKSGLDDLRQKLSKRLDLKIPSFRIKYKDEEDDLVLITCDEDLQEFLGSSRLSRSIDHRTIFDILVFPVAE